MCFSKLQRHSAPEVAKEDMIAFKVLKKKGDGWTSPVRGGPKWRFGKSKLLKDWETTPSERSVNRGLHCYRTLEWAVRAFGDCITNKNSITRVFLVVIPFGAKYYANRSQYCTDHMILQDLRPIEKSIVKKTVLKKVAKKKK